MSEKERFIESFKNSEFRYKDEIFNGLDSGEMRFDRTSESKEYKHSCKHFLDIYQGRATHLKRFDSAHANRLREETVALCKELAKSPNENCNIWTFFAPPHSTYHVFVSESGGVLGTLLTASKLLMTADEWEKLWGRKDKF